MKLRQVNNIPNFYLNEESGIYYVRKMVNGRLIDKSTGLTTHAAAWKKYVEIMKDLQNTKAGWAPTKVPSVREWWTQYRAAKTKSPSTWKQHEWMMEKYVFPSFGNYQLTNVTRNMLERFFNQMKKHWADSTITTLKAVLGALFQAALDDDLIDKNPMKGIYLSPIPVRTNVLTPEDAQKIFTILPLEMQDWFVFMLGTGLRLNEALSLRMDDLDLPNRTMKVKGKGFMGHARYRVVPLLFDELLTIVEKELQAARGKSDRLWKLSPQQYRYALGKACQLAGLPHISPHTLRHTFATRYLQSGGSVYVLSKLLGHSSIKMTEKVYAHLLTPDIIKLSAHVNVQLPSEEKPKQSGQILPFVR